MNSTLSPTYFNGFRSRRNPHPHRFTDFKARHTLESFPSTGLSPQPTRDYVSVRSLLRRTVAASSRCVKNFFAVSEKYSGLERGSGEHHDALTLNAGEFRFDQRPHARTRLLTRRSR